MIFSMTGRKKSRPNGGPFREPDERVKSPLLWHSVEALTITAAFVIIAAAITQPPALPRRPIAYDIDAQSVALDEVRADIYFESEDLKATQLKRDETAAKTPDAYRVDWDRVEVQIRQLDDRIQRLAATREELDAAIGKALQGSTSSQTDRDVVEGAVRSFADALLKDSAAFQDYPGVDALTLWLMPALDSVPKRQFAPAAKGKGRGQAPTALPVTALEEPERRPLAFAYAGDLTRLAREGLEYVLSYGVLTPGKAEISSRGAIIILRENPVADQKMSEELPLNKAPTPRDATQTLADHTTEMARSALGWDTERPVDWTALRNAAVAMAKACVADTLFFDQVYTEGARERARLGVAPVVKEIQPGEVIQRSGDRWTAQSRSDVQTYWKKLQQQRHEPGWRVVGAVLANLIFTALTLGCLARSVFFLTPKQTDAVRNLNLALLLTASSVVLGRLVSYFEPTGFVLPTAAAAILLAILTNPRVAVMGSLMINGLVSIQFGYDWRLLVVGSAMSLAAVFSIFVVRRRGDMTRAALKATLVGVLAMAAVALATDSLAGEATLRRICLVLLNGGVCMLIVPGVLSPLERLFGITTDIQLLEYSDLNNELLSRMAIEIPATYAHSLMLGQIAEAAADAIGANGLLARVCAYYHDIGKLRRPEYFSENQNGVNVHDDLPPRASARAIAAHVTHGLETAREHHLPKPIADAILEHHGTCPIGFFYQQAVEQHRHQDVHEEDFRYPGPKPQSRETAILMICDAVESGVRSIKNPNEERVREFVDKIIRARFADRQFDQCSLTLKDLDLIRDVLTVRVVTALHTRIAYPDKTPERPADNIIPMTRGAR